jgi:hypothetical protein
MPYSYADVSAALSNKGLQNGTMTPSQGTDRDDDATTTTSGSYIVDPADLCNEIDDLFFKDMVV